MLYNRLTLTQKSLLYASKTFIGGALCWYALRALGIVNPLWSVITVMIVSDPDLSIAAELARARVINTLAGCFMGLMAMLLVGYSPLASIVTAALTVFLVTSIKLYPANWRLAPVTVIILMDAARQAATPAEELHYVLMRGFQILVGCAVALLLARFYGWFATRPLKPGKAEHSGD